MTKSVQGVSKAGTVVAVYFVDVDLEDGKPVITVDISNPKVGYSDNLRLSLDVATPARLLDGDSDTLTAKPLKRGFFLPIDARPWL